MSRPKAPSRLQSVQSPMREVLAHLYSILIGCGFTAEELLEESGKAIRGAMPSQGRPRPEDIACFLDAPHVLTLWHTDPAYVDARSRPRPLPLSGGGASLEQLARRVNPDIDPSHLIEFLQRFGAIRRRGAAYVPSGRALSYRGHPIGQHLHGLRVLQGMLQNVAHNVAVGHSGRTWFEYLVDNGAIPATSVPKLRREIDRVGMSVLRNLDARMRNDEQRRTRAARRRVALGLYYFEDPPEPAQSEQRPAAAKKSVRRSAPRER